MAGGVKGMGIFRKKAKMLQKIKEFFRGMRCNGTRLSYVEQQVDEAAELLEMMDRAKVLGIDIEISVRVGERQGATVLLRPGSTAASDLYQIISRSMKYWVEVWGKEVGNPRASDALWQRIERNMDWVDQGFESEVRGKKTGESATEKKSQPRG